MSLRTYLDTKTEVTLLDAVNTIAFPTDDTFGASIAVDPRTKAPDATNAGAWRFDGAAHVDAAIFLTSSAAMDLSAGVGLFGFRADTSKWYLLAELNNGDPISTLDAACGWSTTVQFVGVYDRLAIGPLAAANVTPTSGTVTATIAQLKVKELV